MADGPDDIGLSHTVGLEDRGHAEVIVVGLPPSTGQSTAPPGLGRLPPATS